MQSMVKKYFHFHAIPLVAPLNVKMLYGPVNVKTFNAKGNKAP